MPNNQVFIEKVKKKFEIFFWIFEKFSSSPQNRCRSASTSKKISNFFFQIVRLPILGKVMASWGLFKAPFKRYREKTSGGVETTPPGLVGLIEASFKRPSFFCFGTGGIIWNYFYNTKIKLKKYQL